MEVLNSLTLYVFLGIWAHTEYLFVLILAIYSPVTTVEDMLLKFYDICGPITQDYLEKIDIADNEKDSLDFGSLKVKPSKWHIFDLVHGLKVDSKTLLNSLEPTRPRLYSLCNDPSNKNIVELVVTIHALDEGHEMLGLCSQYFKSLQEGTIMYCSPHPSHIFDIAINRPDLPVLMVANGSGIAPFRYVIYTLKYTAIKYVM